MNRKLWKYLPAVSALALTIAAMPSAHAQCGLPLKTIKPAAFARGTGASIFPLLQEALPATADESESSNIVGMWHVIFTAKTMNKTAIPATEIDNSLVVWHKDGTEIMNSGRPPQDGNFCMGVWERSGVRVYKLNHFAWAANGYTPGTAEGVVGQPIGPVHYREEVVVEPDGNHYTGQFTLEQYDTTGREAISFTGTLKGTRITINTKAGDLL